MFEIQWLCLKSNRILLCWNCKYQYDRPLLSRILLPRGSGQCHTPGLQLHHGSLLPCWVRPARALLCWVIPGQYRIHLLSTMSSWKVHSILYCSFVNWYYSLAKRIKLLGYNKSYITFCRHMTIFNYNHSIIFLSFQIKTSFPNDMNFSFINTCIY